VAALALGVVGCKETGEAPSNPAARTADPAKVQPVSATVDRDARPELRYSGASAEGVQCWDLAQYRAPGVIWPRTTWVDELYTVCDTQRIDDPTLIPSCNGSNVVYEPGPTAGRRLHYDATTGKLVGIYEYDPAGRRCYGAPTPVEGCAKAACRDFRDLLCEGGSCVANKPRGI
jgi:hypothetical protein